MSDKSAIVFKDHAILRMLERGLAKNEVVEALKHRETIEEYKDDFPYPSCLMFKIINGTSRYRGAQCERKHGNNCNGLYSRFS